MLNAYADPESINFPALPSRRSVAEPINRPLRNETSKAKIDLLYARSRTRGYHLEFKIGTGCAKPAAFATYRLTHEFEFVRKFGSFRADRV